jgi:hypothetical protein
MYQAWFESIALFPHANVVYRRQQHRPLVCDNETRLMSSLQFVFQALPRSVASRNLFTHDQFHTKRRTTIDADQTRLGRVLFFLLSFFSLQRITSQHSMRCICLYTRLLSLSTSSEERSDVLVGSKLDMALGSPIRLDL